MSQISTPIHTTTCPRAVPSCRTAARMAGASWLRTTSPARGTNPAGSPNPGWTARTPSSWGWIPRTRGRIGSWRLDKWGCWLRDHARSDFVTRIVEWRLPVRRLLDGKPCRAAEAERPFVLAEKPFLDAGQRFLAFGRRHPVAKRHFPCKAAPMPSVRFEHWTDRSTCRCLAWTVPSVDSDGTRSCFRAWRRNASTCAWVGWAVCQLAMGRLTGAVSLKGASVSRLMVRRCTVHSSFCSSSRAPTRHTTAASLRICRPRRCSA